MTEGDNTERDDKEINKPKAEPDAESRQNKDVFPQDEPSQDLHAATKGVATGKKGGKGYGECWHCGGRGHPRRECPFFNEPNKGKGSLGAFKGGKHGGKGKGKQGKGGKGKDKGKWGKGYNYKYRSPGKGVGKGLNQLQDDWYSVWGAEYDNEYDYYGGDYDDWNYGGGLGSIMMKLERRERSDHENDRTTRIAITTSIFSITLLTTGAT